MMSSFDPDHALAILLQARFNEEAKKGQLKNKENVLVPISKPPSRASLIDQEWETSDPCPDIHGLFVAFNDRFFWGRLLGVEVKWSPQMTSCAGICVYEGRQGLCSVRLSAPLLKLRPRSDLVETLLHEMIHAYLFVTHNNRDRDGHGPEFHKHMHRINREAGTNITVYHSFHAEVKMYQQHWWRCDGPCQRRPPFFGMVKRAKNRAPGPNDLWWANHKAECGGHFIKVREPEDYKNKKKGKEGKDTKPINGKDIRNFFKKPNEATTSNDKVGSNIFSFNNHVQNKSNTVMNGKSPQQGNSVNRVVGFGNLSSNGLAVPKTKSTDLSGRGHVLGRGTGPNPKPSSSGGGIGRGGTLVNRGGGTLVVAGKQGKIIQEEKPPSPNTKLRIDHFKAFSGSGFTLGCSSTNKTDRSRSRLLSIGQEPEFKKQKTLDGINNQESSMKDEYLDHMCSCSVCNKKMPREEIDVHLESCAGLQNVFNNSSIVDTLDDNEIKDINTKYKVTSCPVCSLHVEGDMNAHLDECLNTSGILNMFDEPPIEISDSESPVHFYGSNVPKPKPDEDGSVEVVEPEGRVACPLCGMRFGESRINAHVNQCLDSGDEM